VYESHGIATEFRAVTVGRTLRAFLWEVGAAAAIRRQLRAVRAELER
jgi:hypothetical protein